MQAITQLLDWNEHCLFIFESNVHKKMKLKNKTLPWLFQILVLLFSTPNTSH